MATNGELTVEGDRIVIEQFEVEDSDIAEFVSEQNKPPAEALRLALRVGVSTLKLADTTEEAEFVRNEFKKLNRDLQDELDEFNRDVEDELEDFRDDLNDWFDEESGDFATIIDNHFGENGRLINEVFDPTNNDSPLETLRSEIERELQDMRDSLLEENVRGDVEQETTKKGEKFEDDLEPLLRAVTRSADEVTRTGDDHGQLDDRFVGDFVVTLAETQQDIVIEAKDWSTISKPKIKEELSEGIRNRGADYGLLVLKNEDAAPQKLGAFREFDQRMLYVALSDEETETYDQRLLNLALEWGRMRTLSSQFDSDDQVDASVVHDKISEIEDSLATFKQVRTKCTNIKNARQDIEEHLDEIEEEIEREIDTIVEEVSVS
jgi:hypothetical protein